MTAAQVGKLATAISLKTGIDDEQIQASENLILTFKNIKNEGAGLNAIFDRTTKAAIDLSAAGFGDTANTAKQLGKALNDPVKGLTALTRSGVTFTEQQKTQIGTLVESGKTLQAQKIILKEVESQVGGAAAASATAGEKAAVAYGNLKEQIGTALLPILDKAQLAFVKFTPTISAFIAKIGPASAAFGQLLAPKIRLVVDAVQFLQPVFERIGQFMRDNPTVVKAFAITLGVLATAIGVVTLATTAFSIALNSTGIPLVIIAIAALAAGLVYAYQNSEQFRAVVDNLGVTFTTKVLPALQAAWAYIQANVIPVFMQVVGVIRDQVLPIIGSFAVFLVGTLIPAVIGTVLAVGQKLKPVFDQLISTFQAKVLPVLQLLLAKFREYQPTIQRVIEVIVKLYGKYLQFHALILGKVLPVVIRFAGFIISTVVPAVVAYIGIIAKIIGKLVEFGKAVVDRVKDVAQFVQGAKDKFGDILDYVKALPGKIVKGMGNQLKTLYYAGLDLIAGFLHGIIDKAGEIIGVIKSYVTDKIPSFVKNALGIKSPSKVFHEIGLNTMLGFRDGIKDNADEPIKAATDAATSVRDGVLDRLKEMRDGVKSSLEGLKGDFDSLRDSVASAFTGNLFEATTAEDFLKNLRSKKHILRGLKEAFIKLRDKFHLDPAFLSQLFQSGNFGLILDLADGPWSQAMNAQSQFEDVTSLANQLGGNVANAVYTPAFNRLENKLKDIEKAIKQQSKDFAKELNNSAVSGAQGTAA